MRVGKVIAVSDQYRTNRNKLVIALFIIIATVSFAFALFYYYVEDQLQRSGEKPSFDPADKQEIRRLKSKSAEMRRVLAVEIGVTENLRLTIKELKDEIGSLNEEVQFYKRIMVPQASDRGLGIKSLVVHRKVGENGFQFILVLMQRTDSNKWVTGNVEINVQGVDLVDGTKQTLNVSSGYYKPHTFGFRYFQEIEGWMALPDGFEPTTLVVRVRGEHAGNEVEEYFDWESINFGSEKNKVIDI
ncbi:MAG: hypothetical protein MK322_06870 [Pseudomonadales bacterium]|nr:hypothetical protein [Pseudomonadales bacterium]